MSETRVELIRRWTGEGKSLRWIGAQLGLTGARISQIAGKNGIKPAGENPEALRLRGKALGEWMRQHPELRGKRRHEDFETRLGLIKWAASTGKTYDEVALLLGVSRNVVAGMAHRNGVKFGSAA